jgi:hypothetical protein
MLLRTSAFAMSLRSRHHIGVAVVAVSITLSLVASMGPQLRGRNASTSTQGLNFDSLPLSFEPNVGSEYAAAQEHYSNMQFLTRTPGGTFYFAPAEVVLALAVPGQDAKPGSDTKSLVRASLHSQRPESAPPNVMHLQFVGASPNPNIRGGEPLPGTVSYFRGNDPAKWDTGLPTYAGITYEGLYSGIDLRYDGTHRQLKGTYIVAPGSDPTQIRWRYDRADKVIVDDAGNLQITLNNAKLIEGRPVAWQDMNGEKREVQARYALAADGSIGFALGSYDPSQALAIDPTLTYSSYLGASFDDNSLDIAVDSAGNVYVTGTTQADPFALGDLIVTKINAAGTAILYTAIFMGNDYDVGYGIVVDGAGNAYVAGETYSTDFPTVNAFQPMRGGHNDAFVLKLNPAGSFPVYATYIGGLGGDQAWAVAVDGTGSAYITGVSGSTDYPLANAFQSERIGTRDVIVSKFSPDGLSLLYSTYLGGISAYDVEVGYGIAVDSAGSAYVTGYTDVLDFPLQNPIQPANGGFDDTFVTKFAPSGSSLVYSTYLGGDYNDIAYDLTLDDATNAYIVGYTTSTNFPLAHPYQPVKGGYDDVFVTKINAAGSAWLYSTYLGGLGPDGQYGTSIEVAPDGSMIVAGDTQSSDFPVGNWVQQFHANPTYPDIFVTHIAPSGAELLYSTFLGGAPPNGFTGYPIDVAYGLARDTQGNAYITGQTNSPNWPIAGNPFQPGYAGGSYDGLVAKIDLDPQGSPVPPAPTPGLCATTDYVITQSSGAQIVPGTIDIGNHCNIDGCTTGINLPFPFTLYDRTFTSAYVDSGGTLGFLGNQGYDISECLPQSDPQNLNFGILAYWDYVETDGDCIGGPCGIYTSISGSSPNRIFNIEWRTRKYRSFQNYDPVNFEIRLYENSTNFEVIYGAVSNTGADATYGVQRDTGSRFTQYACHTAGSVTQGLKLIYTLPTCTGPQPTSTPAASPTPTHTATAGAQTPTSVSTAQATGTTAPPSATQTATPVPTCSGTWERVNSPTPNEIRSYLYDVEVITPDNIWAAGSYNTTFGLDDTLILHWNGSAWSQVTGPGIPYSGLYSVSAIAPNDVWAVGYYNPDEFSPYQPLAIHWNGISWSQFPTPGNVEYETTLQGVDAVSTSDVWAVGENENGQLIMHWDGNAWTIVSHPLQHEQRAPEKRMSGKAGSPDIYFDSLYAVAAVSANDIWAVGSQSDHSLAMHWNGSQWATVGTPNPYSTVILSGLSVISANDIWAVGSSDFYAGQPRAVTIHWDGSIWSNVPTPGGDLVLTDVAAFSTNDIWAVGYEQIDQYHTGEVLLHRQGTLSWVRMVDPNPDSPTLDELYGIATSGPNEAWAVGLFDGATLVDRYTNMCGTATPQPTGTSVPASTATATSSVPTATAIACLIAFEDVGPHDPFYSYIRCLACRGIISGYDDGTFRPGNNITRGQIAKMVSNAAALNNDPGDQIYEDVDTTHPFFTWINRLSSLGYMSGYPCDSVPEEPCNPPGNRPYFRPFANATRGQLAKIVSNAAGIVGTPTGLYYADVAEDHPFYVWIMRLTNLGVMSGYPCGGEGEPCDGQQRPYFRPFNNVTRGQASKIAANTFFPDCSSPAKQ